MSTSDKTSAPPAGNAAPNTFPDCPYWGKGGRYVIDITNGQRIPVADEKPDADTNSTTVKEKKRG